ncbi:hypothetical protein ACJQWK_04202 [Exserohilum turcicum]
MQLSVIAALIPLVSLVTAVGNWNCYNKDSDKAKAFSQFEDWYPNGACVNDAGVGLPAQMCTSDHPCITNLNGTTAIMLSSKPNLLIGF